MKRSWSLFLCVVAALPLVMGVDLLRSRNKAVEEGNQQLKTGHAEEALADYDKALAKLPRDPGVHFARGAALYGLKRYEEATQSFLYATEAKAPEMKASAFYNLGNSFFQSKKFDDAVESFKKSLAYDPHNMQAKRNLELALRSKREEDKKKDDQKKDDKDGKKDKKDEKKDKPDPQAKNEDKNGNEKGGDKDKNSPPDKPEQKDKQDDQKDKDDKPGQKADQQAQDKDQPKDPKKDQPPSAQNQPTEDDKKPPGEAPKNEAQPANPDPNKKPENRPGTAQETEAILDSLERSPKALEQQLARIRAMNRKAPVKDW